jgi:hypothetical protein
MDLGYSTAELAFRDDVRGWLRENPQQFGDADHHLERLACPQ